MLSLKQFADKKKMIAALAVTTTLLTSGSAYATDAGLIIAALPNEEAVCRYGKLFIEKQRNIMQEIRLLMADFKNVKTREEKLRWNATKSELLARSTRQIFESEEARMVIDARYPHLTCEF